jgi:hypothetical protein
VRAPLILMKQMCPRAELRFSNVTRVRRYLVPFAIKPQRGSIILRCTFNARRDIRPIRRIGPIQMVVSLANLPHPNLRQLLECGADRRFHLARPRRRSGSQSTIHKSCSGLQNPRR